MHWQHIWTINCTSILWRPSLAKASQNPRRGIPWFITVHWKQKRISKDQYNNSHKMTQAPVKNPVKKIKIAPDDCCTLSAFNAAIKVLPLIWGFPRKFMALPPILQFLLSSNFCWNPPSYPLNQELSHWNNSICQRSDFHKSLLEVLQDYQVQKWNRLFGTIDIWRCSPMRK